MKLNGNTSKRSAAARREAADFAAQERSAHRSTANRSTQSEAAARRASAPKQQPNPNWAQNYQNRAGERPYRHKCLVCGRTDTEYPDLEFRYCSKCKGYCCYCIDHINNHVHIQ